MTWTFGIHSIIIKALLALVVISQCQILASLPFFFLSRSSKKPELFVHSYFSQDGVASEIY